VREVEVSERVEATRLGDGGTLGDGFDLVALGVQLLEGSETRHVGGQRRNSVLRDVKLLQIYKLAKSLHAAKRTSQAHVACPLPCGAFNTSESGYLRERCDLIVGDTQLLQVFEVTQLLGQRFEAVGLDARDKV
jgi:hypothetical protein